MIEIVLSESELRELARWALYDYPGDRGDCPPSWISDLAQLWISDLAQLPAPNFHAFDRLMQDGLIAMSRSGWRLTDRGRFALDVAGKKHQEPR